MMCCFLTTFCCNFVFILSLATWAWHQTPHDNKLKSRIMRCAMRQRQPFSHRSIRVCVDFCALWSHNNMMYYVFKPKVLTFTNCNIVHHFVHKVSINSKQRDPWYYNLLFYVRSSCKASSRHRQQDRRWRRPPPTHSTAYSAKEKMY